MIGFLKGQESKIGDGLTIKSTTSLMGTYAAEKAIADAGIDKNGIDFIIFSTLSPDCYFPGSGVLLQRNLGIKEIGALDVRNQ